MEENLTRRDMPRRALELKPSKETPAQDMIFCLTAGLAPSTRLAYEKRWDAYCQFAGSFALDVSSKSTFIKYIRALAEEGAAESTFALCKAALKLRHAVSGGLAWILDENIDVAVKGLAARAARNNRPPEIAVPTREEIRAIAEDLEETVGAAYAWAARIQYAGGLRISELEKVRLAELETDVAVIRLRNTKTKWGIDERQVAREDWDWIRGAVSWARAQGAHTLLFPPTLFKASRYAEAYASVSRRLLKRTEPKETRYGTHALRYAAMRNRTRAAHDQVLQTVAEQLNCSTENVRRYNAGGAAAKARKAKKDRAVGKKRS